MCQQAATLSPRDQSIVTVAEFVAVIMHVVFYGGFPAVISVSGIAARALEGD
jgi:alkylhydroperoxidase/carboxymuconolactone decarboxylase family protein YurZ